MFHTKEQLIALGRNIAKMRRIARHRRNLSVDFLAGFNEGIAEVVASLNDEMTADVLEKLEEGSEQAPAARTWHTSMLCLHEHDDGTKIGVLVQADCVVSAIKDKAAFCTALIRAGTAWACAGFSLCELVDHLNDQELCEELERAGITHLCVSLPTSVSEIDCEQDLFDVEGLLQNLSKEEIERRIRLAEDTGISFRFSKEDGTWNWQFQHKTHGPCVNFLAALIDATKSWKIPEG